MSTDDYQRPENIGKENIKGMELDAQYRFTNGIELRGAYSHTKGEYENNDPMRSILPDSALVSFGFDSPTFWRAITKVRYQAAKKQEDATVKNAYGQVMPATDFLSNSATVVDLIDNFDVTDTIYINVAACNIFDKEYFTAAGFNGYYRNQERAIWVHLKYDLLR